MLDIEEYGGVEVNVQTSINFTLDISAVSASLHGHFILRERARKTHRIIG